MLEELWFVLLNIFAIGLNLFIGFHGTPDPWNAFMGGICLGAFVIVLFVERLSR